MTAATTRPDTHAREPAREPTLLGPTSRHPGDAVRVGLGIATVLVSLLAIQRDSLTTFERNLFRLINELPDAFAWVLGPVMQMGNVVAAPATAVVAYFALGRNRRVAIDITVVGVLAWFGAKFVKSLVERPRPGGLIDDVSRITTVEGFGFVSGHTAVATAIVAAASPYLPRRLRRAVWLLPLTVGIARIYYGAHLPLDIVGGAAVGWTIAAAWHLALGAPRRVPTLADAERALASAGVEVDGVERLDVEARGSFPFSARLNGAARFVKLLDPEPRDRDWVYRAARFVAFRDVRDEVANEDPSAQAHREAAMTLLARSNGARVPKIEAIQADGDRVWIVEEKVASTTLGRMPSAAVTDEILDSLWRQVALLRAGQIAHRDLVASNVLVDDHGEIWITDFAHAKSSTHGRSLDNDVAELLVSTGLVVGVDRAVDAARRVLGPDALAAAVPELHRFVLTSENQRNLRAQDDDLLTALRRQAATAGGVTLSPDEPEATHVARSVAVVALAAGVMAALFAVAGAGDVADVVATPGYRWLGLALLSVLFVPVSASGTLLAGIDRRLALGRTAGEVMEFQRRSTLDGRATGTRSLVRRLVRAGVPGREARIALLRWTRTRAALSLVTIVAFVALVAADDVSLSFEGDAGSLAAVLIGALGVELALSLGARDSRDVRNDATVGQSAAPLRADVAMTVLTSTGEVGLGVLATTACVLAMGGGVAVTAICLVAATAGALARVAPVSGGPGTATALLVLGLVVVGTPIAVAVAAALAAQLLQLWVPVVGGVIRSTILAPW